MSDWIKRADVPRDAVCRQCGSAIRILDDIGEYRNLWPGPRRDYLCYPCHMSRGRPQAPQENPQA